MGKSNLMDRVASDLARGHTHPATQRLHSLVAAHPTDLDLRRQLAEVYRQTGHLVEAGRWSYLDEGADPIEILAFERAFPSPSQRRAALRWPERALPPTGWVRNRLDEMPIMRPRITVSEPKAHQAPLVKPPAQQRVRRPRQSGVSWLRVSAAGILGSLATVGIYAVAEWIIR